MPAYKLGNLTPKIAASAYLAPNATVLGHVILAEHANIWFGATIRGDNEEIRIGAGSNVQDGAVLHTDPGFPMSIAAHVSIGHQAMLHGCTVGEGSLIGIQAIVLNVAKIGKGCLYIKRLTDVSMAALEELCAASLSYMADKYPLGD